LKFEPLHQPNVILHFHQNQNKKFSSLLKPLCCYPIFDPCLDKFKKTKRAKNIENPKKYISNTLASFLAFLASSQKNLKFQRHLERVQLLTCYF